MQYTMKTAAQEAAYAAQAIQDARGFLANVSKFLELHRSQLVKLELSTRDVNACLTNVQTVLNLLNEAQEPATKNVDLIGKTTA